LLASNMLHGKNTNDAASTDYNIHCLFHTKFAKDLYAIVRT